MTGLSYRLEVWLCSLISLSKHSLVSVGAMLLLFKGVSRNERFLVVSWDLEFWDVSGYIDF